MSIAPARPRSRFSFDPNRARLLTLVTLFVVCVLAATLGVSLGHKEPAHLTSSATATAGEVTFTLTRDFVSSQDRSGAEALGLQDSLELVDVGYAPAGVLAGRVPHPDPATLLPRRLGAPRRTAVSLDGARGWLYADVSVPERLPHAEVYALPATTGGSLLLVCDVPALGRGDCTRLIARAQLSGNPAARASRGAVAALVTEMRNLRRTERRLSAAVASATTSRGRNTRLRALGGAYSRTAAALQGIPAARALDRALGRLASAYRHLGSAVAGGRRATVIAARSAVSAARADVATAFRRISNPTR